LFLILEPKRHGSCRCWLKPHTCALFSNEVVTCTPGKPKDGRTICCKVKDSRREEEVRISERRKKAIKASNLPGYISEFRHKMRWIRHVRLGRFVA